MAAALWRKRQNNYKKKNGKGPAQRGVMLDGCKPKTNAFWLVLVLSFFFYSSFNSSSRWIVDYVRRQRNDLLLNLEVITSESCLVHGSRSWLCLISISSQQSGIRVEIGSLHFFLFSTVILKEIFFSVSCSSSLNFLAPRISWLQQTNWASAPPAFTCSFSL